MLSDHAAAEVSYTVRCQLVRDKVHDIHESYGPEGIWSVLRDVSRRTVIIEAAGSGTTIGNVLGDGYGELERRVAAALTDALAEVGFELKLFSLRNVDLGVTGEIVQDTIRAGAELEREQALRSGPPGARRQRQRAAGGGRRPRPRTRAPLPPGRRVARPDRAVGRR